MHRHHARQRPRSHRRTRPSLRTALLRRAAVAAALGLATFAATAPAQQTASSSQGLPVQVTFNPDPSNPTAAVNETWTVPAGVTEVTFYVDGGAGGAGGEQGGTGGTGGTIEANFAVTPGQTYAIVVAGNGANGASGTTPGPLANGGGGATGGGDGGSGSLESPNYVGGGGGGGGESTVATASGVTTTTLLLAPGGGGGGGGNGATLSGGNGGDGGAAGQGSSDGAGPGSAGTDDQGGAAGMSVGGTYGAQGQANQGGAGMSTAFGGGVGGGGAGAFGGGSGGGSSEGAGGGGGGSYYVATSAADVAMKTGAAAGQVAIGYSIPNQPPPPPPVVKVTPHPSISGVAAAGSPLNCLPGVAVGAQATLTYQWLANTQAIAGATASQLVPNLADSGDHLQCTVVATNSAGAVTATSSFVTVPAQGVPASVVVTIVGRVRDRLGHPFVNLVCSPQATGGCTIALVATVKETLNGSTVVSVAAGSRAGEHVAACATHCARKASTTQKVITVAQTTVTLATGKTRGVSVPWTSVGMKLLALARRLPAMLTATGTLVGEYTTTLSTQTLTMFAPASLRAPAPPTPKTPPKPGSSGKSKSERRS